MSSRWPPKNAGGGGSGISGLTANKVPVAATSSTIVDGPFTIENPSAPVQQRSVLLDGGGTGNVQALHVRPTSGGGNFGAGITLDNIGTDGAGAKQWLMIELNANTSYPSWLAIIPGITALLTGLLISPAGNVYIHDDTGDFGDNSGLTIGSGFNLHFRGGGGVVYEPAIPADWTGSPPTTLAQALDRVALWIKLNGGGPLP